MGDRQRSQASPTTDSTLTGADWYGRTIEGETHSRVLFVDLDMTDVVNAGAVFTDCTFRAVRFNASRHTDAAFLNCTFTGCTLFDASFTDCKLLGSTFDRCTFDLMRVSGGNWSMTGLAGADLRRATIAGARLRDADLRRAKCRGASMCDVDLAGALLDGADLSECDLRGSDLSGLEPGSVKLSGAIVTIEQALVIATALGLDVRAE